MTVRIKPPTAADSTVPQAVSLTAVVAKHSPARSSSRLFQIVNLENFESCSSSHKSVFNSPRSLAVCQAFGVHPTELLPKRVDDFAGVGAAQVVRCMRYDHFEKRRQAKLTELRAERQRRIESQHEGSMTLEAATTNGAATDMSVTTDVKAPRATALLAVKDHELKLKKVSLDRSRKRELVLQRALTSKSQKEHDIIARQLEAEEKADERLRHIQQEYQFKSEAQRLKWLDAREAILHNCRREEYSLQLRQEKIDQRDQQRIVNKYGLALAKEKYLTPRSREQCKRSSSSQR